MKLQDKLRNGVMAEGPEGFMEATASWQHAQQAADLLDEAQCALEWCETLYSHEWPEDAAIRNTLRKLQGTKK